MGQHRRGKLFHFISRLKRESLRQQSGKPLPGGILRVDAALVALIGNHFGSVHYAVTVFLHEIGTGFPEGFQVQWPVRQSAVLDGLPSLLALQTPGYLIETALQPVLAALLDIPDHLVGDPFQLCGIPGAEGIQHPVNALPDQGVPVQFHLVGGKLANLPGEGLERLLEETVYGAHGEGGIVVKYIAEHRGGGL